MKGKMYQCSEPGRPVVPNFWVIGGSESWKALA